MEPQTLEDYARQEFARVGLTLTNEQATEMAHLHRQFTALYGRDDFILCAARKFTPSPPLLIMSNEAALLATLEHPQPAPATPAPEPGVP